MKIKHQARPTTPKIAKQKQLTHTTVGNNKKRKLTSNTKTRPTKTINPYNCRKQQEQETYIKYQNSPNKNNLTVQL